MRIALVTFWALVGCDGKGDYGTGKYALCKLDCDRKERCKVNNDAETESCNNVCDMSKSDFAQLDMICSRLADIYRTLSPCFDLECSKVTTCIQMVDMTCNP